MPPDGARSRPRRRHQPNRTAGAPVPGQFSNLSRRKPSRSASSVLLSMLLRFFRFRRLVGVQPFLQGLEVVPSSFQIV